MSLETRKKCFSKRQVRIYATLDFLVPVLSLIDMIVYYEHNKNYFNFAWPQRGLTHRYFTLVRHRFREIEKQRSWREMLMEEPISWRFLLHRLSDDNDERLLWDHLSSFLQTVEEERTNPNVIQCECEIIHTHPLTVSMTFESEAALRDCPARQEITSDECLHPEGKAVPFFRLLNQFTLHDLCVLPYPLSLMLIMSLFDKNRDPSCRQSWLGMSEKLKLRKGLIYFFIRCATNQGTCVCPALRSFMEDPLVAKFRNLLFLR